MLAEMLDDPRLAEVPFMRLKKHVLACAPEAKEELSFSG